MAAVTILKQNTGKAHLTSVDEANDTFAISGLVRTAAGAATLYTDAFTTGITIGATGTPVTVDDNLIVSGEIRGPSDGTGIVTGEAGTGASTGSTIQIVSLTTTERDDLVEADGMIVYNETDSQLQGRVRAAWVNLGAGAAGGETNTGSNVGIGGVGVFDGKVGVDLQFKNINFGSSKVTITDDSGNSEIDIDVVPADEDWVLHGRVFG